MKKSRVDKIVDLFKDIEKPEVKELVDKLAKEYHIYLSVSVPLVYVDQYELTGKLLK